MKLTKRIAVKMIFAISALAVSTPALAFYIYSWDLKYKKDCHVFTDPLRGTTIVCGKWNPAVTRGRAKDTAFGKANKAPAEFPAEVSMQTLPKEYVRQAETELQKAKAQPKPNAAVPPR